MALNSLHQSAHTDACDLTSSSILPWQEATPSAKPLSYWALYLSWTFGYIAVNSYYDPVGDVGRSIRSSAAQASSAPSRAHPSACLPVVFHNLPLSNPSIGGWPGLIPTILSSPSRLLVRSRCFRARPHTLHLRVPPRRSRLFRDPLRGPVFPGCHVNAADERFLMRVSPHAPVFQAAAFLPRIFSS